MNKILAATGATAALVAASGLAFSAGSATASADKAPQGRVSATAPKAPIRCDGGAAVQLKSVVLNSPFQFGEAAANQQDQSVPGAVVSVPGPARGTDTLLVTFSAETQLTGGTPSDDWMGMEVHVDGVPIQPYNAAGDVLAFASDPGWMANSIQFCTKVGPGNHVVKAVTNLSDFSADSSLRGWLDDATLSVVRYN